MMHLGGLILFTLFLRGTPRRTFRVDDYHHDARQHDKSLSKTFKVLALAREALLPGGFGKASIPRQGLQAGVVGATYGEVAAQRAGAPFRASRRGALSAGAALLLPAPSFAATGATSGAKGKKDQDELMDPTKKAAKTPEAARKQIVEGYKELGELLSNMDKIAAEEGGDGVRRVLGTVGTTSAVYLIEPAFRLLFEADDTLPMEYIDDVEQIMRELQDADGQAYAANFITFSSAKGKPEDYYRRAAEAITRARTKWLDLMAMLELKP